MTYAPEHEKLLLNRSHRRRMGAPGALWSASQQARTTEMKTHSTREILNAIFYLLRSGCAWWRLPALGDRLLVV